MCARTQAIMQRVLMKKYLLNKDVILFAALVTKTQTFLFVKISMLTVVICL